MREDRYVVLDINLIPMISKNVHNEIVKCFLNRPVDVFTFYSPNLFLTEQEIRDYDKRLLDFTYILIRKGVFGYELTKAFEYSSKRRERRLNDSAASIE